MIGGLPYPGEDLYGGHMSQVPIAAFDPIFVGFMSLCHQVELTSAVDISLASISEKFLSWGLMRFIQSD